MDERKWARARDLATAYADAYSEDVAEVLGEALLDALAELLVPKEEREAMEGAGAEVCGNVSSLGFECERPVGHAEKHSSKVVVASRPPVINWGQD